MGWLGPRTGRRKLSTGEQAAHRKPGSDAFAKDHDIGHHASRRTRPQRPGPTKASDHLIDDQQSRVVASHLLQRRQKVRMGQHVASSPLDRLDQDCRDAIGCRKANGIAQEIDTGELTGRRLFAKRTPSAVSVRSQVLSGQKRQLPVFKLATAQSQDAVGFAVEAAPEPDHLALTGGCASQPQSTFDGFGPGGVGVFPEDAGARPDDLRPHMVLHAHKLATLGFP